MSAVCRLALHSTLGTLLYSDLPGVHARIGSHVEISAGSELPETAGFSGPSDTDKIRPELAVALHRRNQIKVRWICGLQLMKRYLGNHEN